MQPKYLLRTLNALQFGQVPSLQAATKKIRTHGAIGNAPASEAGGADTVGSAEVRRRRGRGEGVIGAESRGKGD